MQNNPDAPETVEQIDRDAAGEAYLDMGFVEPEPNDGIVAAMLETLAYHFARHRQASANPPALDEANWIVWSNEHRAFWAPNRCGYTVRIEKAGRYSQADAEAICRNANYRANSTINVGTPPEICMPAPEALSTSRERERELEEAALDVIRDACEFGILNAPEVTSLAMSAKPLRRLQSTLAKYREQSNDHQS